MEIGFVSREEPRAEGTLLASGNVDQADNSAVLSTSHDCQLAKVFVEGDENPPFADRGLKDLIVPRIPLPGSGPLDIVTKPCELGACPSPDT